MNIISLGFIFFLSITILLFYCVPRRLKNPILLIASLIFIATFNPFGLIFIFLSSLCTWLLALQIDHSSFTQNDRNDYTAKYKKLFLALSICLNISILIVLKYVGSYIGSWSIQDNPFSFLIPIGLSYYTLQIFGYSLDVYWERIKSEKSYFRLLLFLCYFPQLIQGPINRYKDLSYEIFDKDHSFDIHNIKHGAQLMLWGYFQVMVIGDRIAPYVTNAFFKNKTAYGLAAFLGLVLFGFQLYTNFSGGINIIQGLSQCFGIQLPDNFRQPFFSTSLGDFWRRWHISLGAWMKDYIFYPFSMSKGMSKLKKAAKKHVNKRLANHIPIAIADIVVFLLVGIWHGTGTNYALWGLYNGIILAFSELMTDVYKNTKNKLNINEGSRIWSSFCIIRTFIIVTIGWCTDCAFNAVDSAKIIYHSSQFSKTDFAIFKFDIADDIILVIALISLLTVSILHEKNIRIREALDKKPFVIQMIFWSFLIQVIFLFYASNSNGGFIYADF